MIYHIRTIFFKGGIFMTSEQAVIASVLVSIFMVVVVNVVRFKTTQRPVKSKMALMMPAVGMAMGFSMFINPVFWPTQTQVIISILLGMLFSIVLIQTSKFEIRDGMIYLQRSKWFALGIFGLLFLRMGLKFFLTGAMELDGGAMSGSFFIMAYFMILPWRLGMLYNYSKLEKQLLGEKVVEVCPES